MAITKTKFINYVRCPRYVALDDVKKNKLDSSISFEQYQEEEQAEKLNELYHSMYDSEDNDLIDTPNPHLDMMLPYYNQVEIEAGYLASKYFDGSFRFARDTKNQMSFEALINSIRYICYIDIYNETKEGFNIIEVKATTSNKYLSMGKKVDGELIPIFQKKDGIYYLLEDLGLMMDEKAYNTQKNKLFDKFSSSGRYIYDLAVQRYIIEHDSTVKNKNVKYYLAVLNHEYVFDGTYKNGQPDYRTDANGNDIVTYFDMTSVTEAYMDTIDADRKKVESYIYDLNADKVPLGPHCEYKKITKCKYAPICWKALPKKNSIMAYIGGHHGFTDEIGNKYDRYDLINDGYYKATDLPKNYLNRKINVIQRECIETNIPYVNIDKIRDGISQITYPIYHLDFETFPCPMPRYRGEKCYSQSVFQFSLHIEKERGLCDKEKDHFEYLAPSKEDCREELIKKMIEYIDTSKGTILVYNQSFEKTRLKELATIFPKYKKELLDMREMVYDLLFIVQNNSKMYEELGYSKEDASLNNYYNADMNGSYSIKKVLPLFSDLSYNDMEVANGVEAMITYETFDSMTKEEYRYMYQKLLEYCKQDTWAMVEVLWGLIKMSTSVK